MKIGWKHALNGLRLMLKSEKNFRLQAFLFILLLALGLFLNIEKIEWIILLICSALVFSLEIVNSSIEKLCDLITEENNVHIAWIKDVAASAVLLAALFSVIISILIFAPYFYLFLQP